MALATERWDWEPLALAFGGLAAAAAAGAGAFGLARGLDRVRAVEQAGERALERLQGTIDEHAVRRAKELEHLLARERAETLHLIAEQERALREERRAEAREQADLAQTGLMQEVADTQERLERRLSAWSTDLERAQQHLKARLEELIRKQAEALQAHEARLADHAAEVAELEDVQRQAIGRLSGELERALAQALEETHAEIETHAAERRRALHEVSERLRARERSMREQIQREESEVRTQLAQQLEEVERRQLEQLERSVDRSVVRLGEEADRRFDVQLRDSRERTADRLGRELELQMETFTRAAEQEVAARITDATQVAAAKLQRQLDDVVRAAEGQTAISNERIRELATRLERSLEAANQRLAAFEANVELELAAKLAEIERAVRAAEQAAERERA